MKNNRAFAVFLAVLIIFALTGCRLAIEDKGEVDGKDILIGVFVTDEYLDLFDMESNLNDNLNKLSGGGLIELDRSSSKYQGRLYATLKTLELKDDTGEVFKTREFVFEGINGIPYFAARVPATGNEDSYITTGSDEAISDRYTGFSYSDYEDKTTLEGTIYISSDSMGKSRFVNPVYQSADGSVYVVAGSGMSLGGEQTEGSVYTQILEETTTVTENGKSKSKSTSIKISMAVTLPSEQISILQMDKNSEIISKTEYAPGKVPDSLTPEPDAEYIIVESFKRDLDDNRVTSRSLYDKSNKTLETFYVRGNGICVKKGTTLEWSEN
ncbi:MAG: hypothetical protein ACOYIF_05105 [Acetivibrionales bacterium]